jgi:1-acyl-sn-glycerol-3-phosphate acyltransferase
MSDGDRPGLWSAICGAGRLALILVLIPFLLPFHFASRGKSPPGPVAHMALKWATRLLRLRVTVQGEAAQGPILFVANHISWADIPILGGLLPASFVAKSEVAGWPLIGWLARRAGTVFVERRRGAAAGQRDDLAARLATGGSVILFAEGVSAPGDIVQPFKPALFAAAVETDTPVQPVTIVYKAVGGAPVRDANRLRIAWVGEATLLPHVWWVLRQGGAEACVILHEPVQPAAFASRGELAKACRDITASALPG